MKSLSLMLRVSMAIALCASLGAVAQAQNREKFGISAKAGGVNLVSGRVMVRRTGQAEQLLTDQDNLTSSDIVSTASGARIEVLLNPGSYFRATENSEFELTDSSLNNLQVKLIRGSAVVEATGADDTQLRIGIVTDQSRFVIIRRGVYRINVQPGLTEVLVQKGRILINDSQAGIVKGGARVVFTNNSFLTSKLSRKDLDDFDGWSKQRAETLARANQKLSTRVVNGYLDSFNYFDWTFSAANPRGLWAFSPFSRCFTFIPFYYGWISPYGLNYGHYWEIYDNFPGAWGGGRINRRPVIVSNPPLRGPSGGSSGSTGNPPSSVISPPVAPRQLPPRDPDSGGRGLRKPDLHP
jgi:hypothetical protein